jgi:hypothetical protein
VIFCVCHLLQVSNNIQGSDSLLCYCLSFRLSITKLAPRLLFTIYQSYFIQTLQEWSVPTLLVHITSIFQFNDFFLVLWPIHLFFKVCSDITFLYPILAFCSLNCLVLPKSYFPQNLDIIEFDFNWSSILLTLIHAVYLIVHKYMYIWILLIMLGLHGKIWNNLCCYFFYIKLFILQEQECFLEELRKAQRRLLKVSRDRRYLI